MMTKTGEVEITRKMTMIITFDDEEHFALVKLLIKELSTSKDVTYVTRLRNILSQL